MPGTEPPSLQYATPPKRRRPDREAFVWAQVLWVVASAIVVFDLLAASLASVVILVVPLRTEQISLCVGGFALVGLAAGVASRRLVRTIRSEWISVATLGTPSIVMISGTAISLFVGNEGFTLTMTGISLMLPSLLAMLLGFLAVSLAQPD